MQQTAIIKRDVKSKFKKWIQTLKKFAINVLDIKTT